MSERGDLISSELMSTKSLGNNQIYVDSELTQTTTDQFSLDPVQYGYSMYKITYETIDIHGNTHEATGVVSYPRVDWPLSPSEAFPIISYQHGTVVERSSVTSVSGIWIFDLLLRPSSSRTKQTVMLMLTKQKPKRTESIFNQGEKMSFVS